MNKTANIVYLRGILENDFSILQQIYNNFLPGVIKYIKKNSGTVEDAKDVFQEAIIVVFRRAKDNNLEITTSFQAFLFGVCKMIWLKKLKKRTYKEVSFEEIKELSDEETLEGLFDKKQKWALFEEKFNLLHKDCQQVLQLSFNKISGRDIAHKMGYTEEYVKRKKYKCKQTFAKLIKSDPIYRELKN